MSILQVFVDPQVSSNGLISFTSPYMNWKPQSFPMSNQVVAPYWDDSDTRLKGFVKYGVITRDHPCLLDLTSGFISSREGVEFEASWLLIAHWVDICPFPDFNCIEVKKYIHNLNNIDLF